MAAALLLVLGLASAAGAQEAAPATASLEPGRLPAAGSGRALLAVPIFGRYSIRVESERGTALQLVDRMSGPGDPVGRAGGEDGRLDLFLDRGEYRIHTHGPAGAEGDAALSVHPFVERGEPEARLLVEGRPVAGELGDLEQVSYWLEVRERRRVVLEAAGRHLADLRLWLGGSWLFDAEPRVSVIEPRPGRPLRLCELTAMLEPGLYLVRAYGAPGLPWAEEDGGRPFHLRWGWPELPAAGRKLYRTSPFGFDRYLLPAAADYLRLELPEARAAELESADSDPEDPFAVGGRTKKIDKKTLPPVAEILPLPEKTQRITVRAAAGQAYVLQHFRRVSEAPIEGLGRHWISTLDSGDPRDSFDATALLVRSYREGRRRRHRLAAKSLVEIGPGEGWARRANLLAPLTLHVGIEAAGQYELESRGVAVEHRIEPFLRSKPEGYEPPPFRAPGAPWDLEAGLYLLTLRPAEEPGIAELLLRPRGWKETVLGVLGLDDGEKADSAKAMALFPEVDLRSGSTYRLHPNQRPEVRTGVVVRPLPLDLGRPLPLVQRPGEVLEVPFRAKAPGLLLALAEDGSRLEIQVGEGEWSRELRVAAGDHLARVRHGGEAAVAYSLEHRPLALLPESPLPALPAEALAGLPELPLLDHREDRFFDLERGQTAVFLLRAEESSLFRLESTGLLDTEGNLRSRTRTSLERAEGGGTGRNFRVQSYLRSGDYQVTVRPRGKSRGRVGLRLGRSPVRSGGDLEDGVPARGLLAAGEAVAYRFRVETAGRYRFRSLGLGRELRIRLEDSEGWPLTRPGAAGDLTLRLEPGEYRLIVLPGPLPARQLTLAHRLPEPVVREGHGPHALPLGETVRHLWLESPEGEPRVPDRWRFTLPAPARVEIALGEEIEADLLALAAGGAAEEVAYAPPGRGWAGEIAAGDYEVAARSVRRNNRLDYTLRIDTRELLAGQDRLVQVPAVLELSVGEPSLVELSSFGGVDVEAWLEGASGLPLGRADDRPGDWNFLLSRRLAAGRYRLRVEPVAAGGGETRIAMRLPPEVLEAALALPAVRELAPGPGVHLLPLELASASEALVVGAESAEAFALSLEAGGRGSWRTLDHREGTSVHLLLPLRGGEPPELRLRLRSLEGRGNAVRLSARGVVPEVVREAGLAGGLRLRPLSGIRPPLALATLAPERPGCLQLAAERDEALYSSPRPGRPVARVEGPVPMLTERLWIAAATEGGPARLQGARARLHPGAGGLELRLPAGEIVACDLAARGEPDAPESPETGWVLLRAATAAGRPGLAVGDSGADPASWGLHRHFASSGGRAVALGRVTAEAAFRSWSAAGEEIELALEAESLPPFETRAAGWGRREGSLEPGAARAFRLPVAGGRLRLLAAPGTVLTLLRGGRVESVHWRPEEPLDESLSSAADTLLLYRPADLPAAGRWAFEVLPAKGAGARALAPGRPFEARMERSGTLRLPLASTLPGSVVRVAGAETVELAGADGSWQEGRQLLSPEGGGELRLEHGVGWLLAWVDEPGRTPGPWSRELESAPEPRAVEAPALLELRGPAEAFALEVAESALLRLESPHPSISRLEAAGREPVVRVHDGATRLEAYLPPGSARLTLRAPGSAEGALLQGEATLTLEPVVTLVEGLGPEVLLGAGESRAFSFRLERAGPVGVGVAAEDDRVETLLLAESGRLLGRGTVQMHELEAGTYVLLLRLPAAAPPVAARPAVVGLEPPGTGPPEEVLRGYLPAEATAATGRNDREEGE